MRVIVGEVWMAMVASVLLVLCGCGSNCNNGCKQDPEAAGMSKCGKYKCVKGSEDMCLSCMAFYNAEDPCADGKPCTADQRENYAKLGYACAVRLGMVPIDPKHNLPAVDCPVGYYVDKEALCPPGCAEVTGGETNSTAQAGFLMTAYDTAQGTRYVIVEADKDYDPKVNFSEAASDLSGVAQKLQSAPGSVAVYLTEFPLINTAQGQTSRQPKDSEIELIRQSIAGLGKSGDQVQFVRWK